jgi:hypothetical protein
MPGDKGHSMKANINIRFRPRKIGTVLNSEDETGQNSGWAIVELPAKATVGMTIPLLKEAK